MILLYNLLRTYGDIKLRGCWRASEASSIAHEWNKVEVERGPAWRIGGKWLKSKSWLISEGEKKQTGLLEDIWMVLWSDFNSSVCFLPPGRWWRVPKKSQSKYLILAYKHSLPWPVKLQQMWCGVALCSELFAASLKYYIFKFHVFVHILPSSYKAFPSLLHQLILLLRHSRFKFPILHKIFFDCTGSHRSYLPSPADWLVHIFTRHMPWGFLLLSGFIGYMSQVWFYINV